MVPEESLGMIDDGDRKDGDLSQASFDEAFELTGKLTRNSLIIADYNVYLFRS